MSSSDIPADKLTYNDDPALGKPMPDMSTLKWLKGEAPKKGEVTVVLFWAKYAKGDYKHVAHFNELLKKHPELQLIGISCDAEEGDAAKFLTKIGKEMAEQNIKSLDCDYAMAFDVGKVVGTACKELSKLNMMSAGMAYILNKEGTIVWREGFSSSWVLDNGQFGEQLRRVLKGEALIDNGAAPDDKEEEDDDTPMPSGGGPDPSEMFAETGDY